MAAERVLAGRYRINELIGQGGMARVYRGHDLTLGRDVAIKILEGTLATDAAFRMRFRMEAQAASRMSHPSIVRVFDAGDSAAGSDDPPFIVMELVRGRLLKDVIADGPVPLDDAIRYVDGILEALEYSHRAGVVHRDIKPGNVMITPDGGVKVMDFGIARAVSDSSATVAETSRIIGTAAYLSPEQAQGDAVDARTDLYSVGIVLYELLAGRQPFRGDSPVAVVFQHVSEAPQLPTEVNETAPHSLNPVVLRALAKDPDQRFPDAASFRAALAASVTGRAPSRRKIDALTNELYGSNPRHTEETIRTLRQLSTDTTMTRTQSGPPVVWIWAGLALLAVLLASVVFWVANWRPADDINSASRAVPPLAGMTFERAEQELAALDLVAKKVLETSDSVPEGIVIRSDPAPGINVLRGQEIAVYVSSGVVTTTVPPLEGLTAAEARTALEAAGLGLGTITRRNDPHRAEGIVLEASHESGAEVRPGTTVNLIVASGRVALVNLVGFVLGTAVSQVEDLGLVAVPIEDPDCPATNPRTVWSMSVPPGDVPIHSTVELIYCTGD